jgi:hypothetical protein
MTQPNTPEANKSLIVMAGSSGRCNGLGQGSAWCSEAKGLPRARVEFEGNGIEVGLTVPSEVGPFGKVLA